MADNSKVASFEEMLRAGRKKKENERLAQEIFGKRRSSTPVNANKKSGAPGSLASRVGVTKRPSSLSRSQSSQARVPQARAERDASGRQQQKPTAGKGPRGNGLRPERVDNVEEQGSNSGMSIKGAAGGPCIVIASNFAEGTTAADIESVMSSVGGEVTYCKLVASSPTVIAEMGFKERSGADTVISTFNNKKADGRVLYIHLKDGNSQPAKANHKAITQSNPEPEPQQYQEEEYEDDTAMDVDENARSREAENKLREERRGAGRDNQGRADLIPSEPRNARAFAAGDDYYHNNNNIRSRAQAQPRGGYQGGQYGYGRGSGNNNGGYASRGRYYDDDRDRRGNGDRTGQQWRG